MERGTQTAATRGEMRRLFVGGLSHTVTQKELKDRFGKFGDVVDVELRTRRDEEGEKMWGRVLMSFFCHPQTCLAAAVLESGGKKSSEAQ